jgi:hypothetical protein
MNKISAESKKSFLTKPNDEVIRVALLLGFTDISSDNSKDDEMSDDDECEVSEDKPDADPTLKAQKELTVFQTLLTKSETLSAQWKGIKSIAWVTQPVFADQKLTKPYGFDWNFDLRTSILDITFYGERNSDYRRVKLTEFSFLVKSSLDQIFTEVFYPYFATKLFDHARDLKREQKRIEIRKEILVILNSLFD